MHLRFIIVCAVMLIAPGAAFAQLPFPFGQPPPDIPNQSARTLPKCTPQYEKELEQRIAQLEAMRNVPTNTMEPICKGIEGADSLLPGPLKDIVENFLSGLTKGSGIPRLDFRFLKHMCRQGQGEISRQVLTDIGHAKAELMRCGPI